MMLDLQSQERIRQTVCLFVPDVKFLLKCDSMSNAIQTLCKHAKGSKGVDEMMGFA
jgi:hypothetical protein